MKYEAYKDWRKSRNRAYAGDGSCLYRSGWRWWAKACGASRAERRRFEAARRRRERREQRRQRRLHPVRVFFITAEVC